MNNPPLHTGTLQSDTIDHACVGRMNARRRVASPRFMQQGLNNDGTGVGQIEVRAEFCAMAGRTRSRHHWRRESSTSDRDREIDGILIAGPLRQKGADLVTHSVGALPDDRPATAAPEAGEPTYRQCLAQPQGPQQPS